MEFSKNVLFIYVEDYIIKKIVFEYYIKNVNVYWLIICEIFYYFSFSIEFFIYIYLYKYFLNIIK